MARFRSIPHVATNLLTFAVRLVGLASALNQLLIQPHPASIPLAVSGFMVAGGQLSKEIVFTFLDRMLGPEHHPELDGPEPSPHHHGESGPRSG